MAESLVGAVVPATAVPAAVADSMVATEAVADSTLAAEDIPVARLFGVGGQPRHGRWVVALLAGFVARPIVPTSVPGTLEADPLARMARGKQMARSDKAYELLMQEL